MDNKRGAGAGKDWRTQVSYQEAERMLRAGKTQQEVGDHFGVTQAAIAMAIRRGQIKSEQSRMKQGSAMPWRIRAEHRSGFPARMLRSTARSEAGLPVGPTIGKQAASFIRGLDAAGEVIDYDPEAGFQRVPRRSGVDRWWIRDPFLNADGSLVEDLPDHVRPKP